MVEDLIKKEEKLKLLLIEKQKLLEEINNLKKQDNNYLKMINDINSKIKTNSDFKILIDNFNNNKKRQKKEIIKKIIGSVILLFSVVSINYGLNYVINLLINFSYNAVLLISILEAIFLINYLVISPCFEYENVKKSIQNMKMFILEKQDLEILENELCITKKEHDFCNTIITNKEEQLNFINQKIMNSLSELIKEDKIRDLLLNDLINNKDNSHEINLIMEDYDNNKELARKK